MKFLKSISLFCIYPALMFLLGFASHIEYERVFYPQRNKEFVAPEKDTREDFRKEDLSLQEVAGSREMITNCDTSYEVIECNLQSLAETVTKGQLPEKYLGMNRETFLEALRVYELSPSLEDQEKGFVSLDVTYFSTEKVIVQKNYRPIEKTEGYYLLVQDGRIVVFEEDRTTVYLTTDIEAEELSDGLKQELIQGKYIDNWEELYGFLESYSS